MKRRILTILLLAAMLGSMPGVAAAQTFTRHLALGSIGSDVMALQQFLKDKGFLRSLN